MTLSPPARISVNGLASPLVTSLIASAQQLRVTPSHGVAGGERLIDAGAKAIGGIEAGLRIAEICMGGLGSVRLVPSRLDGRWSLSVRASDPVLACLASQYAGWSMSHGEGGKAYHVLGSGPGRAVAAKEHIFHDLDYKDAASQALFVLETAAPPPPELVASVAKDCGLPASALTFIYAPTTSLAGTVQVVSRVLEVALHKAHALKFPLSRIVDGMGTAPLPPPSPDFLTAMGRTNDAIIFGGEVQLYVTGPESEAEELAAKLPSRASNDFGRPFAEIFEAFDYDFYKVDTMLFSPAAVTVTALETGRSFRGGSVAAALLARSFA